MPAQSAKLPRADRGPEQPYRFGVGLRGAHYSEALENPAAIDFVEVHTENFFAAGGASKQLLSDIGEHYQLSLHCTGMGLGSAEPTPELYLQMLGELNQRHRPLYVSDHASFNRGRPGGELLFSGDLLPLVFEPFWLRVLSDNVKRAQDRLGRQILVENISAYYLLDEGSMSEPEFLNQLVEQSGCGLLLDLNNILVNTHNQNKPEPLHAAIAWVDDINLAAVQEVHLAGYSQQRVEGYYVDDHAAAVNDECWALYRNLIGRAGPLATLVEWDNNLPSWQTLLGEIETARAIVEQLQPAINTEPQP